MIIVLFSIITGYSVTLLHSKGLIKNEHNSGIMYAKVRFVDHDGKVSNVNQQEKKTPSITPTTNPDWKEFDALFKAHDGFDDINFIRIDICIDDYSSKACIGNCFIPLRYFNKKAREYSFALTPKSESGLPYPSLILPQNTCNPFGEITVKIQRFENDADKTSTMMIKPSLMESNVFNTRWFTESYTTMMDSENNRDIETFSLMPAIEYLELVTTPRSTFHINKRDSVSTTTTTISKDPT